MTMLILECPWRAHLAKYMCDQAVFFTKAVKGSCTIYQPPIRKENKSLTNCHVCQTWTTTKDKSEGGKNGTEEGEGGERVYTLFGHQLLNLCV